MNFLTVVHLKLRVFLKVIKPRDLLVIFLLNSLGAVLNALHYTFADRGANLAFFEASILEYIKVYNLLGFALIFSYFVLSPGPDIPLSFWRLFSIGGLSFGISLPLSFVLFDWSNYQIHPLIAASSYLLGNLLLAAWAVIVVIYIKRRESTEQFQNLRNEIAKTTEQRDKAELELHLLQAQLEPHFFFNTLANLHNLIDIDRARAKHLLEELTGYLRSSIPQFRQRFITLKEELDIVERYLTIQKIRYGHKLTFTVHSAEPFAHNPVLPMSVLTLVENSIKHGIEKSRQGGFIEITTTSEDGLLKILVTDSAGLLQNANPGTGLGNLRARLAKVYQKQGALFLYKDADLTCAKLEFPLQ